jgi:uncharacterized protein (TIGR02466 family)
MTSANTKKKQTKQNHLNNAQLRSLFPTPLIIGNVPDIKMCDRLEKAIKKQMASGNVVEEPGVRTTNDQLHVKGRGFEELVELVVGEANQFMNWMHLKRDSLYVTGMWANVTTARHRHPLHIHPNSLLSGVIYVKTPPNCGHIAFSDPRAGARVFEPDYTAMTEFNSGVYSHVPERGTMLMWPSWLPHSVEQAVLQADGEERIVIAFNVQMVGSIDRHTTKLRLTRSSPKTKKGSK